MPLLRQSLYSQNVNLYLAPTADGRDTWLPLMRTVALEGRCVVLSANQCMSEANLPDWIRNEHKDGTSDTHGSHTTYGRKLSLEPARKKPIITHDDHQAVFSESKSEAVSPSESPSGEYIRAPLGLRRKSIVTEDGNEIVLPRDKGASREQINDDGHEMIPPGVKKPSGSIDETQETKSSRSQTRPQRKFRRQSIVTEDGNEIVLPGIEEPSDSRLDSRLGSKMDSSKLVSRGGSCVISPMGDVVAGPLWDDENGLLVVDVDFDDCLRGRLDLDVGGSYSR